MNWLKESLGIQEPIYGPSGFRSVATQSPQGEWTELKREQQKLYQLSSTTVETQTFYALTDAGHVCMFQLIYNCLAGIRTTCQFNVKIFHPDRTQKPLWTSDTLDSWKLAADKVSWTAKDCKIELSPDGNTYTITSSTSKQAIVNLKCTKTAPGFMAGEDGTSYYGTDPAKPWGSMFHSFWPRCKYEGSVMTQAGEVQIDGLGIYIHALQGYRPNLAAASWNFITFHSPTHSAVQMEFTTPPSYGSTVVTVGAIAVDGALLCAGAQTPVTYTATSHDTEIGWTEPTAATFGWKGAGGDGKQATGTLSGDLGGRADRVDVLAQIPKFLKVVIAQAAGSKPYIYQFMPKLPLEVKVGEEETKVEGKAFMESTFITG